MWSVTGYVAPFVSATTATTVSRWYAVVHWYCRMTLLGLRLRASPPATSTMAIADVLAASPPAAAYFGRTDVPCSDDASKACATYDNGKTVGAIMTSQEFAVPAGQTASLSFQLFLDVQSGFYDTLQVSVIPTGGGSKKKKKVAAKPAAAKSSEAKSASTKPSAEAKPAAAQKPATAQKPAATAKPAKPKVSSVAQ